jgi:putative flippase GtrA
MSMALQVRILGPKLVRFASVGGGCYLLGLALLYVGTAYLGIHYLISMAAALVLVNLVGWYLNRKWTFGVANEQPATELGRYFLVNGMSFLATLGIMSILVSGAGINYLVASAIAAVFMVIFNFMIHGHWTFR